MKGSSTRQSFHWNQPGPNRARAARPGPGVPLDWD
jgi:hypothetical protein